MTWATEASGEELTSQVPAQHQIQYEEAVLVILKRIPHVDDERMVDLYPT